MGHLQENEIRALEEKKEYYAIILNLLNSGNLSGAMAIVEQTIKLGDATGSAIALEEKKEYTSLLSASIEAKIKSISDSLNSTE